MSICMYLLNKITLQGTDDKTYGDEEEEFPHFLKISSLNSGNFRITVRFMLRLGGVKRFDRGNI